MRPRLDIAIGVDPADRAAAQTAANGHLRGRRRVLPALEYTEERWQWVLLYKHAQLGQIGPDKIRQMQRVDLEYLAGMSEPHAALPEDAAAKLRGNVARARAELETRRTVRTAVLAAGIGAGVSLVSVVVTLLLK